MGTNWAGARCSECGLDSSFREILAQHAWRCFQVYDLSQRLADIEVGRDTKRGEAQTMGALRMVVCQLWQQCLLGQVPGGSLAKRALLAFHTVDGPSQVAAGSPGQEL